MPRHLNPSVELKGSALLFAALGDKTRLRLVSRLCDEGPMSITRLTAGSNVTRQAITKHLRLMEEAGVVRSRRHGRESIWQLNQRRLEEARRYLDLICKAVGRRPWPAARVRRRLKRRRPCRRRLAGKRALLVDSYGESALYSATTPETLWATTD